MVNESLGEVAINEHMKRVNKRYKRKGDIIIVRGLREETKETKEAKGLDPKIPMQTCQDLFASLLSTSIFIHSLLASIGQWADKQTMPSLSNLCVSLPLPLFCLSPSLRLSSIHPHQCSFSTTQPHWELSTA